MSRCARRCPLALRPIGWSLALSLAALGCGRTDPLWWAGLYADDGSDDVTDSGSDGTGSETATSDTDTVTTETTSSTDSTTTDTATATTDTATTESTDTTTGCVAQEIPLDAVPATVLLLIDQGAHMSQNLGAVSRWQAIETALFDPVTGVAWAWEDQRVLGLVGYTSFNGGGMCPVLSQQAPAIGNADAMATLFQSMVPEDENPSGDTLAAIGPVVDADGRRTVVLITGRDPDTCAAPNPQNGWPAAITAATELEAAGVETRLVAVGSLDAGLSQEFADVGVGLDPQGQIHAATWAPTSASELTADLDAVLADLHSCLFDLGQVLTPGMAASCGVELDGQPLTLDDPDGWRLLAPDRVEVTGNACTALSQGAQPVMTCDC